MSYNEKHNEANGEDNRDGESHNRSWNCGVEGPTDDPEILALRARQMRNILATLMVSQGTPMISHGDEIGRTQRGNNNVYCQDSELAWMDWSLCETNADLMTFARTVTALRKEHPVFRRRRFFDGKLIRSGDEEIRDIAWLTTAGVPMTRRTGIRASKCVAVFLNGDAIPAPNARGERVVDDTFLLCFNAHAEPVEFVAPEGDYASEWTAALDTADPTAAAIWWSKAGETFSLQRTFGHRPAQDGLIIGARVLSTYRLQMRGPASGQAFTFADADRPARLPRRARGLAPVPVADPDRRRRARRTATTSPTPRRCPPNSAAPRGWPGCRRRRAPAAWV